MRIQRKSWRNVWVVPVTMLALSACGIVRLEGIDSRAFRKDFHFERPLSSAGRLSLESRNGAVEVTGWDKDYVEIIGEKYGATPEERDRVEVDITGDADHLRIRTLPDSGHCNCGASYEMHVPRRVTLDEIRSSNGAIRAEGMDAPVRLRTSNGAIRVASLHGDVNATTSNGRIELADVEGSAVVQTSNGRVQIDSLHGELDAKTSNGPIRAQVVDPRRPLSLRTSNGSVELTVAGSFSNDIRANTSNGPITLRLPDSTSAHVRARTRGRISTDFPVTRQGSNEEHRLEGTIGSGGAMLDLESSNGSIRIARS
jgi:Toastrack DUF4097